MLTQTSRQMDDLLASFHSQSLSFPLDNLSGLSSAHLALVQFHPEATEEQQERAKLLFFQRRVSARGAGVKLESVEQALEDVKPCIKPDPELKAEKRVKVEQGVERQTGEVKVKQEVPEISLLDDDDDEVEILSTQTKREGSAAPKKRKSDPAASSSRPSKTAKQALSTSAPASSRSTPAPSTPVRSGSNDLIKKLPSFRRVASSSQAPTPAPVPAPAPPSVDDDEYGAMPFGMPGLVPRRPPTLAPTNPPAPLAPADPPVATPVAAPAPFSLDELYRPPSRSPQPEVPLRAPLEFKPNYGARPARPYSILPSYVVDSLPEVKLYPFTFRPPPPDPEWTPPHAAPARGPLPDEQAPPELRSQLYTVRFDSIACYVTPEAFFRFLVRGARRLRPRPLAMREEEFDVLVDHNDEGFPIRSFLYAFKSLADAHNMVTDNNGKILPDVEEAGMIGAGLVAGPWPTAADGSPAPPAEMYAYEQRAARAELAVAWKWRELSDEVRRTWLQRKQLPTSKRCPQRDIIEDDADCIISEEYRDELDATRTSMPLEKERKRARRALIATEKKAIYLERCTVWNRFVDRPDRDEALKNGEVAPDWPSYPLDALAIARLKPREEEEWEKAIQKLENEVKVRAPSWMETREQLLSALLLFDSSTDTIVRQGQIASRVTTAMLTHPLPMHSLSTGPSTPPPSALSAFPEMESPSRRAKRISVLPVFQPLASTSQPAVSTVPSTIGTAQP
ncbi:hypothetical protein JCM10207_002222 [Rhodosporidiobolus poonsookiae]